MIYGEKPKKFGIIIFVIVACVVFAATFFVSRIKRSMQINQSNGIEVIQQGDQKIVRNIAEGYQVTVPKEWTIDDTKKQFYSSLDEEIGCKVSTHVDNIRIDIKNLKKELENNIKDEQLTVENLKFEEALVNNFLGIKETLKTLEWGDSIRIYVPADGRLYSFVMSMPSLNIEKCTTYMNDFAKNIILR